MSSIAVVGLAYGDEGKGSCTDFFVRQTGARLVVRFNGGPQASHHVVCPDGRSHGFSQFGSGTFAGARTYLSEYMMVEPYALENEAEALRSMMVDPYSILTINPDCPIITPWHWRLNRLRESIRRPESRHGTCGMGIGELRADLEAHREVFRVSDRGAIHKLSKIREQKAEEARALGGLQAMAEILDPRYTAVKVSDAYVAILGKVPLVWMDTSNAVFEGAQGFLLDQTYGFAPHTTWSDCTQAQAMMVADDEVEAIGVLPLVYTRHGAGPFVTEDASLTSRANDHNGTNLWQGDLRRGHFDFEGAKYALDVTGIRKVVLTMADQFTGTVCCGYQNPDGSWFGNLHEGISSATIATAIPDYGYGVTIDEIVEMLNTRDVEVVAISSGPLWTDKAAMDGIQKMRARFYE